MSKKDNKDNADYSSSVLMWKLLRKHISKSQLIGFSLASLVGLTIVILAVQFHQDVRPLFNDEDSFLRKDYLIITREVIVPTSKRSPGVAKWAGSLATTTV